MNKNITYKWTDNLYDELEQDIDMFYDTIILPNAANMQHTSRFLLIGPSPTDWFISRFKQLDLNNKK